MIKIAMCDDNIETIKSISYILESQIMEHKFEAEITTITNEQKEIFDKIYNNEIDILFLDMDFKNKGKNGIEFAKDLREINRNFYLIFLTAHQRYMHMSFIVKVYDYIVKPTNKAVISDLVARLKSEYENNKIIFLHLNKWISIRTDDIYYIEKIGNNCRVITKDFIHVGNKTLDELLKELPNNFRKSHRSYIVNENKIININKKNNIAVFSKTITCPINSKFNV